MYTKKLIPLSQDDIKKVNATVLASTFNVSQSYASRILKSDKIPTSQSGKKILIAAHAILDTYDNIRQLMAKEDELAPGKVRKLAKSYISEGMIETRQLQTKFGQVALTDALVNFFKYVEAWVKR